MDFVDILNSISSLLWSAIGVIGAIILLWGLWQIIQIVRNLREYGLEFVGFLRGELYKIADKHNLKIMKPSEKTHRIHTILFEEKGLSEPEEKKDKK